MPPSVCLARAADSKHKGAGVLLYIRELSLTVCPTLPAVLDGYFSDRGGRVRENSRATEYIFMGKHRRRAVWPREGHLRFGGQYIEC